MESAQETFDDYREGEVGAAEQTVLRNFDAMSSTLDATIRDMTVWKGAITRDGPTDPAIDEPKMAAIVNAAGVNYGAITAPQRTNISRAVQYVVWQFATAMVNLRDNLNATNELQRKLFAGQFAIYKQGVDTSEKVDDLSMQVEDQKSILLNTNSAVQSMAVEVKSLRDDLQSGMFSDTAAVQKLTELSATLQRVSSEGERLFEEYKRVVAEKHQGERSTAFALSAAQQQATQALAEAAHEREEKELLLLQLEEKQRDVNKLTADTSTMHMQIEAAKEASGEETNTQQQLALQRDLYDQQLVSQQSQFEEIVRKFNAAQEEKLQVEEELNRQGLALIEYRKNYEAEKEKAESLNGELQLEKSKETSATNRLRTAQQTLSKKDEEIRLLKEKTSKDQNAALAKAQREREEAEEALKLRDLEVAAAKNQLKLLEEEKDQANKEAEHQRRQKEERDATVARIQREAQEKEKRVAEEKRKLQESIEKGQKQVALLEEESKKGQQLALVPKNNSAEIAELLRKNKEAEREVADKDALVKKLRNETASEIAAAKKAFQSQCDVDRERADALQLELDEAKRALRQEKTDNLVAQEVKQMRQYNLTRSGDKWILSERKSSTYNTAFVYPKFAVENLIRDLVALQEVGGGGSSGGGGGVKARYAPKMGLQTRLASMASQEEDELLAQLIKQKIGGEFVATVSLYSTPTRGFPEGEFLQSFTHTEVNEFTLPTRRVIVINLEGYPLNKLQLAVNVGVFRMLPVSGLLEYTVVRKSDHQLVGVSIGRQPYEITDTAGMPYMTAVDADTGQARLKCRVIGSGFVYLHHIQVTPMPESDDDDI